MNDVFKLVVGRVRKLVHDIGSQYTRYFPTAEARDQAIKRYSLWEELTRKSIPRGSVRPGPEKKYTTTFVPPGIFPNPGKPYEFENFIAVNKKTGRMLPGSYAKLSRLASKDWTLMKEVKNWGGEKKGVKRP